MYILILSFGFFLFSCSGDDETAYVDELRKIALGVNSKCPQMLDSETRLDGIEIREPNTIVYKHTLINVTVAGIDTGQFHHDMWPGLLSNVKVSSDMKKLRDHQTTLLYSYNDKSNKPICTITITPQQYK